MSDAANTEQGAEHPFDRLENESSQAWEAFLCYRDAGLRRSIRSVARELSKSASLLMRWSSVHDWPKRSMAYDAWMEEQRRIAMQEELQARGRHHAQVIDDLITALYQPARVVVEHLKNNPDALQVQEGTDPMKLLGIVHETAKVMPRLIEASRLVNGMDVPGAEENVMTHVERKSDDEVDEFLMGVQDGADELLALPEGSPVEDEAVDHE